MGIIYGCVLFSRELGLRQVYTSVMLVMAVFFMLLPVFTGLSDVESSIALAGYGTFNVLIWVLLADISFNFRFSSITVFGIGWGMITLGVLLGSMAGQAICLLAPFARRRCRLSRFCDACHPGVVHVRVPRKRPHRAARSPTTRKATRRTMRRRGSRANDAFTTVARTWPSNIGSRPKKPRS